jgi:hypothetical protein
MDEAAVDGDADMAAQATQEQAAKELAEATLQYAAFVANQWCQQHRCSSSGRDGLDTSSVDSTTLARSNSSDSSNGTMSSISSAASTGSIEGSSGFGFCSGGSNSSNANSSEIGLDTSSSNIVDSIGGSNDDSDSIACGDKTLDRNSSSGSNRKCVSTLMASTASFAAKTKPTLVAVPAATAATQGRRPRTAKSAAGAVGGRSRSGVVQQAAEAPPAAAAAAAAVPARVRSLTDPTASSAAKTKAPRGKATIQQQQAAVQPRWHSGR